MQLGQRGFCMNASPVKRDQLLTRSTIYSGSLRQLQNIKNEKLVLDNKRRYQRELERDGKLARLEISKVKNLPSLFACV